MTNASLEQQLEDLTDFQDYLNRQHGRSIAGNARADCDCPLANYLKVLYPDEPIRVACDGIAIGDGRLRHSKLSYEFTRQIDDGRSNQEQVSFSQAKQALNYARQALKLRSDR
ncbi:MAG: hypothetical protein HY785_24795 [Oscillatoriophycideae cyanobacterium NC_groundwater_1537_Pr4_S-0.65um_50_18]|nr:hypothetical protein [Oscillatoriophycideae cyanobacterium NC_groundwater_1537_Pr4_S-0.65um_50_18]